MSDQRQRRILMRGLTAGAIGVAVALAAMTWVVLAPVFSVAEPEKASGAAALVPAYDYQPWHALAVQDGRTRPLESACTEALRQITGRARFEGQDPVAIVLAWIMLEGQGGGAATGSGVAGGSDERERSRPAGGTYFTDWEHTPFILCDHQGLRRQIFGHLARDGRPLDAIREKGRYVSPADLRESSDFDRLLAEVGRLRKELQGKAHFQMSKEQLKAEEVGRRLALFDALCGKASTRLFANALLGGQFLDLAEFAEIAGKSPDEALTELEQKERRPPDPLHVVGLDRVPGGSWFSLGELRAIERSPSRWRALMEERLAQSPQLYLSPKHLQALGEFQAQIKAGRGEEALADVQADEPVLERMRQALDLARTRRYDPEAPEFRLLHLDYLESRFADLYRESASSQPLPQDEIDDVLERFAAVREAYRSGDAGRFADASAAFFQTVRETTDWMLIQGLAERADSAELTEAVDRLRDARESGDRLEIEGAIFDVLVLPSVATSESQELYPGVATIPLELRFNRTQPFLWAWVLMLAATLAFVVGLGLRSRAAYAAGLAVYVASLAVQAVGFYMRVSISGRAPVSNMYETVIFVAFMSALFALVLELIYRRTVIVLAGAAVATLGLVLADQLPLALDPKISPMVPVLRTNYWLTVHVLTIVAAYAGGTLAWGLGNVTLGLMAFGRGQRETLKMLSQFTYRAMQIAVLLLAAGTFLGGWWAAESWGRFWGWDPKEVGALIALVCYVIPLHARYIGWVRDFGLAVSAVLCYAAIILSWYVVNFVLAAGLHSYGFGGGGSTWVVWATLINIEWVLVASMRYLAKAGGSAAVASEGQRATNIVLASANMDSI